LRDGAIWRDRERAARTRFDLLIVGGGVYGIALALEASRRGLSALLVERDDYGGATSANSLRIVHGGLRYLQSFDLSRFRVSVAERRWFLRCFPDLVEPLPCVMPLYSPPRGGVLRRVSALRLALAGDTLLERGRNEGLRADRVLPRGRILGSAETAQFSPAIDREGLRGGILWYDATMPDSERLLIEMLRWAASCGAQALNYVTAERLLAEGGQATGAVLRDRLSGKAFEIRAGRVVNCAGPWARELAATFDRDLPALFTPLLAFNLLLDRPPLSEAALAVATRNRGAQTYFVVPWKEKVLAGTRYLPGPAPSGPTEEQIQVFVDRLNAALPGLGLARGEVEAVRWGLLPAKRKGSVEPADHPVIHDHGARGGPRGLVSVSGVKLTTARAVAERTLETLYGAALPAYTEAGKSRPPARRPLPFEEIERLLAEDRSAATSHLLRLVRRESVVHLDDLLLRRTDWGRDLTPGSRGAALASQVRDLLTAAEALPGQEPEEPALPSAAAL
jgi:glycerol-3-phosphate dehydrogenase